MKNLLTILMLLATTAGASAQETYNYSLQQCIDYALENNTTILNAKLDREIADRQVKQTLADGLPQINGNVDLAYNFNIQTTPIPDFISPSVYGVLFQESVIPQRDLGDPAVFPAQFGTKYSGSATISLEQMIFNGSYFVGLQAARTFTELSRKDQVKSEIDIVEAVTKAYYAVMVTQERKELVERNYFRLDSLLKETQALNENGFAEKIDVNRVQVQFNNIRVEYQNYDKVLEVSKAILKFQMGMNQENTLNIPMKLADVQFDLLSNDTVEGFDYDNRIEYGQLQTNKELVELDAKNTRVQYVPQLDLYGRLGATSGAQTSSDLFNFQDNWFELGVVGLRLNMPIFDGFRKHNILQQKKIQAEQIENTFEQLKRSIDLEIKQSSLSYERSVDNMIAQRENMQLAEEVYNVAKIKYQEGVGSNIEVTNADADYKEAQTNYYDALYSALVAKVELEKAYGTLIK